ncbi:MAG: hypothetical protein COB04_03010 [Gammaproteobacteria bacterium]|nr:MAG: hypothetical protein COB04_03010 [Gammaproteobacteria bacterium]
MVRSLWSVMLVLCLGVTTVQAQTFRFGVTPWQKGQSQDDINHHYRKMMDYLAEKTGDRYILVSSRDYQQMIEYLAEGKVDLASISPVPYVLAKQINPKLKLLVTELSWDKARESLTDSYLGYFVALKTREDLQSIVDLKGKKFGFVKNESSSGFKYPNAILKEKGLDYQRYFQKHYFLGSHPRVTDAVAAGSIDAGATWDFNLKQAVIKHGDVFKIILTSPPIPNLCVVAHSTMSDEKAVQIRRALIEADASILKGLPAAGYVERPDSFYDVVRKVALGK